MIDQIRNAAAKTKKFAQEHPTLSACAVTAVVSWKMSKATTLRGLGEEIGSALELTYQFGHDAGMMQVALDDHLAFLSQMNLTDQWVEYITELGRI
jgi:ABC-type enterochelin transport system permease subunit